MTRAKSGDPVLPPKPNPYSTEAEGHGSVAHCKLHQQQKSHPVARTCFAAVVIAGVVGVPMHQSNMHCMHQSAAGARAEGSMASTECTDALTNISG